jgi:hypothetical protein
LIAKHNSTSEAVPKYLMNTVKALSALAQIPDEASSV